MNSPVTVALAPLLLSLSTPVAPANPSAHLQDTSKPRLSGLEWLSRHQWPTGLWSGEALSQETRSDLYRKYGAQDPTPSCSCFEGGGGGGTSYWWGVSSLALLAFLGEDDPNPWKGTIRQGVIGLLRLRDAESGLIGDDIGHAFLYGHSLALLALARAYRWDPLLLSTDGKKNDSTSAHLDAVMSGASYLAKARNAGAAWRYDVPPLGENDTSISCWAMLALIEAEACGFPFETAARDEVRNWTLTMTEPATGRVGYDRRGSASSRIPNVNDHFPPENAEGMTAAGIRMLAAADRLDDPRWGRSLDLLLKARPRWGRRPEQAADLYALQHTAWVLARAEPTGTKAWMEECAEALLERQVGDGCGSGSWDPECAWCYSGGRLYSTAMVVLALQEVAHSGERGLSHQPAFEKLEKARVEPPKLALAQADALGAPLLDSAGKPIRGAKLRLGPKGESRSAVDWLSRHRSTDGGWDDTQLILHCKKEGACWEKDGARTYGDPKLADALACRALLGAGISPAGDDEESQALRMGLLGLVRGLQKAPTRQAYGLWIEVDAEVALTLVEAFAVYPTDQLRACASKALAGLLAKRLPEYGWGDAKVKNYSMVPEPKAVPNIVSTAIALRALLVGRSLGLIEFQDALILDAQALIRLLLVEDRGFVAWSTQELDPHNHMDPTYRVFGDARVGAALLVEQLARAAGMPETEGLRTALKGSTGYEVTASRPRIDAYGTSLLLSSAEILKGGKKWVRDTQRALVDLQLDNRRACNHGSWAPSLLAGMTYTSVGRTMSTSLFLLALQSQDRAEWHLDQVRESSR